MQAVIQILDENTANQIAAGEVVERPSAVVKELIENAIDAGANNIEIEIKNGGLEFIRVNDNGVGMSFEDARLAVKRHATSKIRTADDLFKISTLGFRGEALPSIAAVSKFTLTTRRLQDELAAFLNIEGGILEDLREAGAGCGTTITVSDLFFNTPARRKFLKTPAAEGAQVSEAVTKLALARPEIAFKLLQNKKLTLVTNGNGNLLDALANLYGSKAQAEVLPVEHETAENIKISGYIGKPTLLKSNRSWQTFIVNDRVVTGKLLFKAFDNAYFSLLPKGGHPLAVLKIDLAADVLDVNVHPQKKEVKFSDEQKIFQAVYNAVLRALNKNTAVKEEKEAVYYDTRRPQLATNPQYESLAEKTPAVKIEPLFSPRQTHALPPKTNFTLTRGFEDDLQEEQPPSFLAAQEILSRTGKEEKLDLREDSLPSPTEFNEFYGLYPLGQIEKCYIIAYQKEGGGLFIIDQHAAHERILYEKLKKNLGQVPAQQLLLPALFDFTASDLEILEKHQEVFFQLGFGFELAGPLVLRLTEIPADIAAENAETIIRQS
ncbi:MAG: DNA mismatch repair endonuclease MutL, partial [Sporomusaceae bacterium]|nr:DNA mismatch repair endonuclease MutL [Sporomusaceae bacterium]